MQSDQRSTNRPVPVHDSERTLDIEANDKTAENLGGAKYKDTSERRDAIKSGSGRRPARSADNASKPRY